MERRSRREKSSSGSRGLDHDQELALHIAPLFKGTGESLGKNRSVILDTQCSCLLFNYISCEDVVSDGVLSYMFPSE